LLRFGFDLRKDVAPFPLPLPPWYCYGVDIETEGIDDMTLAELKTLQKSPVWCIVDGQTCLAVSRGLTWAGAQRSADRRNMDFGGHRFSVQDEERFDSK
jgi:hypothetical protein